MKTSTQLSVANNIIDTSACRTYQLPSGKIWTKSWIYHDNIPNSIGCDSVITINFTVMPDVSVNQTDTMLISNVLGAEYQWLNCNNAIRQ